MDDLQYTIIRPLINVMKVLNLVINGWPSIQRIYCKKPSLLKGFKPCYKWMTFNTKEEALKHVTSEVRFKPCYKWMTFNTDQMLLELYQLLLCFKPCYKWMTFNTLTKGMNVVFMLERSLFYMVAKFEHFSVIHGFLTFYIKFLLQFFCFFLK